MPSIHPTAIVDRGAEIAADVDIGPYCVIGPHVVLGEGCGLTAHVHLTGRTTIGARTRIAPFASLGTAPQSVKYRGGATRLTVGPDCDIREGVTINTGTEDGGGVTEIGARCLLMVGSHVGHDCRVGDGVTFANNAVLGGHVVLSDQVFLGGQAAVHQHVRVGECAMVAGVTGVRSDLIPFGFAAGSLADLVGLNVIGLRRLGVSRTDILQLRRAYQSLFFGSGVFHNRVAQVAAEFTGDPRVGKIIAFIRDSGSRPLMRAIRRTAGGPGTDNAVP